MRAPPLYREIVECLGAEIAAGGYAIGSRLPTEADLCVRFRASRHTVRAALKQLQETGQIRRRQGSGSIVVADRPQTRFASSIASLDDLMQYAASTRLDILSVDPPVAPAGLAHRIGRPLAGQWIRLIGVRRAEGEAVPFARAEIWLPERFGDVVAAIGRERLAVCRLIERRHGIRVTAVHQAIAAAAASDGEAEGLGVEAGAPVLKVDRIYEAGSDGIVEVALNRHPAGGFTYGLTLRAAG